MIGLKLVGMEVATEEGEAMEEEATGVVAMEEDPATEEEVEVEATEEEVECQGDAEAQWVVAQEAQKTQMPQSSWATLPSRHPKKTWSRYSSERA